MLIAARNAMMAGKRLPYDSEIEYLESTGNQWIDTGVREDTTCIINMQATQTSNKTQVVLCNNTAGVRTKWFGTAENTNYYSVGGSSGVSSVSARTKKECVVTFTDMYSTTEGSVSFYFNDDPANVYTRSGTLWMSVDSVTNICVGSCVAVYKSYVKLFGLKIYNTSNGLLRDFIPVRVGSAGYMYDRVTRKLFGNQGTDAFIIGPDI